MPWRRTQRRNSRALPAALARVAPRAWGKRDNPAGIRTRTRKMVGGFIDLRSGGRGSSVREVRQGAKEKESGQGAKAKGKGQGQRAKGKGQRAKGKGRRAIRGRVHGKWSKR